MSSRGTLVYGCVQREPEVHRVLLRLKRSIRLIPHAGEGEGVRYCSQDSQLASSFGSTRYSWRYRSPSSCPPSPRNAVSSCYTPEECSALRSLPPPPLPPTSAFSTDLISSPRASYGNVFPLGATASAEPSVHDTHSKDAPWSSEHKDNRKGLRAPSDGNVILQAFYRHLNSPRAYLYMHTQAHTHAQQIQCCDSRVKPRYHAIIYAWIILLMLLYTIIWMLLQSIKGLIMAIIDMIIGYLLIWSAHSSNHRWEETTVSSNGLYVQHSHSCPLLHTEMHVRQKGVSWSPSILIKKKKRLINFTASLQFNFDARKMRHYSQTRSEQAAAW